MRRPSGRWWSALAVVLAVLAGCSPKKMTNPDLPPETTLFVKIADDTVSHSVNHVVHLYWFGTDPDGEVSGFEWRMVNLPPPADSAWRFTTVTDSVFEVFTPTGVSVPTFEVRAIDNTGLRDPTPARQKFTFTNHAPVVSLTNPPGPLDVSFATLTLNLNASDPDGDAIRFRIWLDGNQASPRITSARTFTIPSADFCQNDSLRTGTRTVFVVPIDNGGMMGDTAKASWPVIAPVGNSWPCGCRAPLLLIDDVPAATPGNSIVDTLYSNAALRNLGSSMPFTILRLDPRQPFRSAKDMEQTFELFNAVMWYRDFQTPVSSLLRNYQDGIAGYLQNGGKFYLEALNLISGQNAPGTFDLSFASQYFHVDSLSRNFDRVLAAFTAAWDTYDGGTFRAKLSIPGGPPFQDPMTMILMPGTGVRALGVRDTNEVAVWAPDSTLLPQVPQRFPVAVSAAQPGGGEAMIMTFAVRAMRKNVPGSAPPWVFLDKVFAHLGITPATCP